MLIKYWDMIGIWWFIYCSVDYYWLYALKTRPKPTSFWTPSGLWFNITISSYQYRKSHCGEKTVVRSSYLHNGISYTGKMSSLYWIRALGDTWWTFGTFINALCLCRVVVLKYRFETKEVHACQKMSPLNQKGSHVDYFAVNSYTWGGHHDHPKSSQWLSW